MTPLLPLALRSLSNRRGTAALTVFAIAVSVTLLLGVQTLRTEARESFARTISGTDLVVGARSGPVNLLLYAVFRIGEPTANVSWASYRLVDRHPDVAWTIPLSLGDSHRGYRVLGTTADYFTHYRYGDRRTLAFAAGGPFEALHGVVLGAEVADALGYALGAPLTLSHGIGEVSFAEHTDDPFEVVGILEPTGTPVDRTLHVGLDAIAAIHDGNAEDDDPPVRRPYDTAEAHDAGDEPPPITAFLVGLKSADAVLRMQRALNDYRAEPLTAAIPGVALQQLWQGIGVADRALFVIAAFVVLAGLIGMLTSILASLGERRREMAILRAVGARPAAVFTLMLLEAALLALGGVLAGILLAHAGLAAAAGWLARRWGLFLELSGPGVYDLALAGAVVAAAVAAGLLPAWLAYRNSLADGLTIRT